MTAADEPQVVTLRSGEAVRLRQVQPGDAPTLARAYAENRTMLALLPSLGPVETGSQGPVVTARVEIAEPPAQAGQDLLDLLTAAAQ